MKTGKNLWRCGKMNKFDIVGKVAIVTGAARGIGKAIAIGLANAGAKIVVADIKETQGQETVQIGVDIAKLSPGAR